MKFLIPDLKPAEYHPIVTTSAKCYNSRLWNRQKIQKQSTNHMTKAQKHIQQLITDHKLMNEDIKGIEIDLNF